MIAASGWDAASDTESFIHLPAAALKGGRHAPYAQEVRQALREGRIPSVYIFAGPGCWDRATRRRIQYGAGSSLVLPPEAAPEEFTWPALDAVVTAWPEHGERAYRLKLRLAQALMRDGVRFAVIEHSPEWVLAWRQGAQP